MEIIDAQIHPPALPAGIDPASTPDLALLVQYEMTRAAMDAVGVDAAVVNTRAESVIDYFTQRDPVRFAGCPSVGAHADVDAEIARFADSPQIPAIRVHVVDWSTRTPNEAFQSGALGSVFASAQRHRVPVFLGAQGVAHTVAQVAEAYPELTLIVDHVGLSSAPPMALVDPDPWADLPVVLALARYPNVSLKLGGLSALSSEPYPHADLWPRMHLILDAFGTERLTWASDYTRLRMGVGTTDLAPREAWAGLYSDAVGFLRDASELSAGEKAMLLGGALRRLLRWSAPA